ncbi:hypothetical protein SBADM41S_10678 [Streptomyces badius]
MPDSQPRRPDDNAPDSADAATTADTPALVLGGARLADGRAVDVRLSGSRIEAVGTAGSLTARGPRIDLRGDPLLPAPAEPHAHGDTALTADSLGPDSPGPASHRAEDIQRRATEAALLQLGHGATALRTHVRVGDVQGLAPLEAVLQARRALRGLADVMPVAVPRLLTGIAGADSLAMLRDAVKMGAAVVGGCPDLDPDPTGYTEAVLEIAAEHGCPVDLHTDADDPARLARLATMAAGLRPGVALGPAPVWPICPWTPRPAPPTGSPPPGSPWSACPRAAAPVPSAARPPPYAFCAPRACTSPRAAARCGTRPIRSAAAIRSKPPTSSPRRRDCAPSRRTPWSPRAPARPSACPMCASRRASRPNSSPYAANGSPRRSPSRTPARRPPRPGRTRTGAGGVLRLGPTPAQPSAGVRAWPARHPGAGPRDWRDRPPAYRGSAFPQLDADNRTRLERCSPRR